MLILFTTPEYEKEFKTAVKKGIDLGDVERSERFDGYHYLPLPVKILFNVVELPGMNDIDAKVMKELNVELCASLGLRNVFHYLPTMGVNAVSHAYYNMFMRDGADIGLENKMDYFIAEIDRAVGRGPGDSNMLNLSFKQILELKTKPHLLEKTTMRYYNIGWDGNRNYNIFIYTLGRDVINFLNTNGHENYWISRYMSSGPGKQIRDTLTDICLHTEGLSAKDIFLHELFDSKTLSV